MIEEMEIPLEWEGYFKRNYGLRAKTGMRRAIPRVSIEELLTAVGLRERHPEWLFLCSGTAQKVQMCTFSLQPHRR